MTARCEELIRVDCYRGRGEDYDPHRIVEQVCQKDGALVAERDPTAPTYSPVDGSWAFNHGATRVFITDPARGVQHVNSVNALCDKLARAELADLFEKQAEKSNRDAASYKAIAAIERHRVQSLKAALATCNAFLNSAVVRRNKLTRRDVRAMRDTVTECGHLLAGIGRAQETEERGRQLAERQS